MLNNIHAMKERTEKSKRMICHHSVAVVWRPSCFASSILVNFCHQPSSDWLHLCHAFTLGPERERERERERGQDEEEERQGEMWKRKRRRRWSTRSRKERERGGDFFNFCTLEWLFASLWPLFLFLWPVFDFNPIKCVLMPKWMSLTFTWLETHLNIKLLHHWYK